jgi:hypothetical protein
MDIDHITLDETIAGVLGRADQRGSSPGQRLA